MTRLLAGDLGGSKTLLAVGEWAAGAWRPLFERRYDSAGFPGMLEILGSFLTEAGRHAAGVHRACIGVAGPVDEVESGGQSAHITNLPWTIESRKLSSVLGIDVRLVNDFVAVAHGITALQPSDLTTLQAGRREACGTRLAVGAGTGLGMATLITNNGEFRVLPSECGHTDFAPADDQQHRLWAHLRERHARVTTEQVLSGRGLSEIYRFLTGEIDERAFDRATPQHITQSVDHDPVAAAAVRLFLKIYGSVVGNLALLTLPSGGVYIAGGIAAKLARRMTEGEFVAAFRDKPPMTEQLARFPLDVVNNERVGLLGAAVVAACI